MGNIDRRNRGVYCFTLVYFLFSLPATTVQSVLLPRRVCLKYSIDLNNASKSYPDESSTEIVMCNKWENMCYILWKKDFKGGKIFVTVLRRGCWRYENNEKEYCDTCLSSQHSFGNNIYFCCCREDLCNDRFRTKNVFQTTIISTSSKSTGTEYLQRTQTNVLFLAGISLSGAFLLLLTCIATMTYFWQRKKRRRTHSQSTFISHRETLLIKFSRPKFISRLHAGKFSEVWYGRVTSKDVVIKKFHSTSYHSWKKEGEIYKLGLNHPGILKIFGACILEETWNLNYIFLVEYHPRGSLKHILQYNIASWQTLCTMGKSLAEALAYLHGEQEKTSFPCIVHQDITSENILVKVDNTCVLCDFGEARVIPIKQPRSVVSYQHKQVHEQAGCLTYMAPEILKGYINLNDIASQLKQIDIYAVGTVLWEISCRCEDICTGLKIVVYDTGETTNETCVEAKNNLHLMLSNTWNEKSQGAKELKELISQCWDEDPEARLSASCVSHRMDELREYHKIKPCLI